MQRIGLLICFGLAACGPTLVQSNASGGYLKLGGLIQGEAEAIEIAEAECAKYGKMARITGKDLLAERMTYECVDRENTNETMSEVVSR